MCLHAQTSGEPVEVHVNGVPVLALPAGAGSQSVTVHEYLQNGSNRISLVVAPLPAAQAMAAPDAPAQPRMAARAAQARARLVLLRQGKSLADEAVRVLAEVNWAVEEGASFLAPTVQHQDLELPVGFPRWRWLDAPVLNPGPADRQTLLAAVQRIAFDLSRGNPDSFLAASRLKLDEVDQAYQRPAGHGTAALREQVQALWQAGTLATLQPPTAETLLLRVVAGGRLLECLNPMGAPALSTLNDDAAPDNVAWPLRLTLIEGKVYILR
ncbi:MULTISPECIES: hypothetical protein [unclassified Roseateles]|uniref:hypothetical protein n=1 Tax=unclassified Roseateles TaxID=2626991 RepID=UPI0012E3CB09|nr:MULTISPECIES: hypothetical protein [unclassified Roseateles]